ARVAVVARRRTNAPAALVERHRYPLADRHVARGERSGRHGVWLDDERVVRNEDSGVDLSLLSHDRRARSRRDFPPAPADFEMKVARRRARRILGADERSLPGRQFHGDAQIDWTERFAPTLLAEGERRELVKAPDQPKNPLRFYIDVPQNRTRRQLDR